jgi:hypothetical protein
MTRMAFAVALSIALMGSTARAQPKLDNFKPFEMGKLAAQIEWMSANCGGHITSYARSALDQAQVQNQQEYVRGHAEGAKEMIAYAPTVSATCSLFLTAYGPGAPASGLWVP